MKNIAKREQYLTCKSVKYYSYKDEDAFFEWIKKIQSIVHFEGAHDELYLDLTPEPIPPEDIIELIALFKRYKINMQQLAPLQDEYNQHIFMKWHKQIFKNISKTTK